MKKLKVLFVLFAFLLLCGCTAKTVPPPPETTTTVSVASNTGLPDALSDDLTVHYIDVGQGDAILIQNGASNMLIDAGDNKYGKTVVAYLQDLGVTKLDYLIGTHPHADHIGGLDDVIKSFDIGEIIMPRVSHSTKTFEAVLDAVAAKNMTITSAKAGDTRQLQDASFTILSPVQEKYPDLNNYSVVIDMRHGENTFLFMGDAETTNESELLQAGTVPKADVLKAGHHGSSTSISQAFLDRVDPQYVIICCGTGNTYGHPHQEILKRLNGRTVLRTDELGTIIIISDGTNLQIRDS